MQNENADVVVVGAGVVGLATALALLERGRAVRVGGNDRHADVAKRERSQPMLDHDP